MSKKEKMSEEQRCYFCQQPAITECEGTHYCGDRMWSCRRSICQTHTRTTTGEIPFWAGAQLCPDCFEEHIEFEKEMEQWAEEDSVFDSDPEIYDP